MGVLMLILIIATLLEKLYGSSFALNNIYHSSWFIALWSVLGISALTYIIRISRRRTLILLHISFVVILLGASISFLTSKHGNILLVKNSVPASIFTTSENKLEKLPFSLQLTDIDTIYSVNDKQAIDYKTHIIVDDKKESIAHSVSLNNPMKIKSYSFCIKGISDDCLTLLVAHDTFGLPISYSGYLMVFASFIALFFDKRSDFRKILQQLHNNRPEKTYKKSRRAYLIYKEYLLLLISTILISVRWYQTGIFPITNGAESLIFLSWTIAILLSIFKFKRKLQHISTPLFAFAIITMLIAIGSSEKSEMQPILRTPLLGVHVTTIIIAYALLCCTAINAVIALFCKRDEKAAHLALFGHILLYPATMLLATGIFIGAMWANISWGRYWGWDPKEVWALITLLICSFTFHTRSLPLLANPKIFHTYCIIVFITMLFTYFGVNYLLGGIHSYT